MKEYTECQVCGNTMETYIVPDEDIFISHCPHCGIEDDRNIYEDGDRYIFITEKEAIQDGYLKNCPITGKLCRAWEIEEIGYCIEVWHKINKGSLTI
jgi:translation initiation factor 2 beta subunit (eIF-2beta)/eIF-5